MPKRELDSFFATIEKATPGIPYEQQNDFAKMNNMIPLMERGLPLDAQGNLLPSAPDMYNQAVALGREPAATPTGNPHAVPTTHIAPFNPAFVNLMGHPQNERYPQMQAPQNIVRDTAGAPVLAGGNPVTSSGPGATGGGKGAGGGK